ncbi:ATP-binding protein [Cupriavidus sp. SK-3]
MREGIRLGLPIVREIARTHGATVTLEQTPGGGLTVSVRFAPGAAASAAT